MFNVTITNLASQPVPNGTLFEQLDTCFTGIQNCSQVSCSGTGCGACSLAVNGFNYTYSLAAAGQPGDSVSWTVNTLAGTTLGDCFNHASTPDPGSTGLLTDVDLERAGKVAAEADADLAATTEDVLASVDAVVIAAASLATAAAVSVSGLIGFVGIVVPHIVRRLVGSNYRAILPVTVLMGGAFLVTVDIVARTIVAPAELPIGVVTAFLGAPFFILILRTTRHRGT